MQNRRWQFSVSGLFKLTAVIAALVCLAIEFSRGCPLIFAVFLHPLILTILCVQLFILVLPELIDLLVRRHKK